MSKPDPAGGSLESILASIRSSLAEQSGQPSSDVPAPEAEDARAPRRHGLAQRLAGTAPELAPREQDFSRREQPEEPDDLSDLLQPPAAPASGPVPGSGPTSGPNPAPPAPAPANAEAKRHASDSDPLWFLTRHDEAASPNAPLVRGGGPAAKQGAPAPEPKLTRPEVLRASMPPFFGSSSDAATASPPAEASPPPAPAQPNAAPSGASPNAGESPNIAHEVSLVAAAAETAAGRLGSSAAGAALNVLAGESRAPAPQASAGASEASTNRALEAVVLELLKPMLRQWLDENMPRLVAEALSEETKGRLPVGDSKSKKM